MDYALIKNRVVENVVVGDDAYASSIAQYWDTVVAVNGRLVGIGWGYDGTNFIAPPAPPAPPPEPPPVWEWFIDLGPFYDRFGATKMAVLTCTDAGVKAIIADLNIRKWVDLQRADVATGLAYVGSKVPSVDAALQTAILTTPVALEENLALRKLYF